MKVLHELVTVSRMQMPDGCVPVTGNGKAASAVWDSVSQETCLQSETVSHEFWLHV